MAQAIMAHPHETTMITVVHGDQELDIETVEDAKWALEGVLQSIDDGARGLERLADTLQDIVTEYEQLTDEG
jgi:archaellum component FlaC